MLTLIILLSLITGVVAEANESMINEKKYVYPITPNDSAWEKLQTVENKINACRIPQNILDKMTEDQLVQAVLDFPFIYDIFVYSTLEKGVENLEKISDAYRELLKRENAKDSLMGRVYKETSNRTRVLSITSEQEIIGDILSVISLYQKDFQNTFTLDEISSIDKIFSMADIKIVNDKKMVSPYAYTVRTPNGTAVSCESYSCQHSNASYHATLDNEIARTYGVIVISNGSCKYNCHSYAWYNQSTNNIYWINNPSAYMSDGSYTRVLSGSLSSASYNVVLGDKIFYGTTGSLQSAHTAIIVDSSVGAPIGTRTVRSKWGSNGVFQHSVTNVPSAYDKTIISAWHR